jgi:hypothetical protein
MNSCVACGDVMQRCCANDTCLAGRTCNAGGTCE